MVVEMKNQALPAEIGRLGQRIDIADVTAFLAFPNRAGHRPIVRRK
jgi:hypothetical protein